MRAESETFSVSLPDVSTDLRMHPENYNLFFFYGFAEEAKANAPCVIFIDELDSVGGKRIESPMHPYSRQTINQLLAEMDGLVYFIFLTA